jgi:hypothetical protein
MMNREEGYGESECKSRYREPRRSPSLDYNKKDNYDKFPCFAKRLQDMKLPHKFKPSNHSKYNGKEEPKQWLQVYSQSIELARGDEDLKALFFPMALEAMPLQWFDKLPAGSIRYWSDLQKQFCSHFAGIIIHPMTATELQGITQKPRESLREYYRRFDEARAQVHEITDREVIDIFSNEIIARWQYK